MQFVPSSLHDSIILGAVSWRGDGSCGCARLAARGRGEGAADARATGRGARAAAGSAAAWRTASGAA